MKQKKIPMRTCAVTNVQRPKKELIRIVRSPLGEVSIDQNGKAPGRGAYLTLTLEVIQQAQKSKALDRKLEVKVPDEIYEELKSMING